MHILGNGARRSLFFQGVLFILLTVTPRPRTNRQRHPRLLKAFDRSGDWHVHTPSWGCAAAKLVVANPATFVGIEIFPIRKSRPLASAGAHARPDGQKSERGILLGILATHALRNFSRDGALAVSSARHASSSGTFLQLDLRRPRRIGLAGDTFAFLLVDLFDNVGTARRRLRTGRLGEGRQNTEWARPASDAVGTVFGLVDGNLHRDSYIESGRGCRRWPRTGLSNLMVAGMFLAADIFLPGGRCDSPLRDRPALISWAR